MYGNKKNKKGHDQAPKTLLLNISQMMESPIKTSMIDYHNEKQRLNKNKNPPQYLEFTTPPHQQTERNTLSNNQQTNILEMLQSLCLEADQILKRHQQDAHLLQTPQSQVKEHSSFNSKTQNFSQFYTEPLEILSNKSLLQSVNKQKPQTQRVQASADKSPSKSKTPTRKSNINNKSNNNSHNTSNNHNESKSSYTYNNDDVVNRLYAYKQKAEAKKQKQKEMYNERELRETTGQPQLQTSQWEFQSLQNRPPIHERVSEDLKKKEAYLQDLKERQELEKRQKQLEQGILADEDIIKIKKDRDQRLKQYFNIESFELKYEREIKQLLEKQRKREQERLKNEMTSCSFTPLTTRSIQSKSPLSHSKNDINFGTTSTSSNSNFRTNVKTVEERLIESGVKAKLKQEKLASEMVPSFKPKLNQMSMKIAEAKGSMHKMMQGCQTARQGRNNESQELEKDLLFEFERKQRQKQLGGGTLKFDKDFEQNQDNNRKKLQSILNAFRTNNNN